MNEGTRMVLIIVKKEAFKISIINPYSEHKGAFRTQRTSAIEIFCENMFD